MRTPSRVGALRCCLRFILIPILPSQWHSFPDCCVLMLTVAAGLAAVKRVRRGGCLVAAGAVVSNVVPAGYMAVGNPARLMPYQERA